MQVTIFDKLAESQTTETVSKYTPASSTMQLPERIKNSIDLLSKLKTQQAQLHIQIKDAEKSTLTYAHDQQDKNGYKGQFSKSLKMVTDKNAITYTSGDSFEVDQNRVSVSALKNLVRDKFLTLFNVRRVIGFSQDAKGDQGLQGQLYNVCVKEKLHNVCKLSVTLTEELNSDRDLQEQLITCCKKHNLDISLLFNVTDTVEAKEGLDKKIYETIPVEKLETFRKYVWQKKSFLTK